jgi:hypothetical protein
LLLWCLCQLRRRRGFVCLVSSSEFFCPGAIASVHLKTSYLVVSRWWRRSLESGWTIKVARLFGVTRSRR